MNEWDVFLAISVILGLFLSVGKPIINLNKNITTLNVNVKNMNDELQEQKEELKQQKLNAHDSHQKLWEEASKIGDMVNDHETRITVLEKIEKLK